MMLGTYLDKIKAALKIQIETDVANLSLLALKRLLNEMGDAANHIRENTHNYPDNSINADFWKDGVTLADYAQTLTTYLHRSKYINYEAHAAQIWANVTLSICGHYHYLVGPAMIANAKIAERMGNIDFAMQAYKAVLNDYESLLEDVEKHEYTLEGEIKIALDSLSEAVDSLMRLYDGSQECAKAIEIHKRLRNLMKN